MERYRPAKVREAIASRQQEKIVAFARAGGKTAAEKRASEADRRETLDALYAELREEKLEKEAALSPEAARRDDLLPAE